MTAYAMADSTRVPARRRDGGGRKSMAFSLHLSAKWVRRRYLTFAADSSLECGDLRRFGPKKRRRSPHSKAPAKTLLRTHLVGLARRHPHLHGAAEGPIAGDSRVGNQRLERVSD